MSCYVKGSTRGKEFTFSYTHASTLFNKTIGNRLNKALRFPLRILNVVVVCRRGCCLRGRGRRHRRRRSSSASLWSSLVVVIVVVVAVVVRCRRLRHSSSLL